MELSGISISKRSKKYLADKWPPWILLLRSTFEHLKDDVDIRTSTAERHDVD